MSVEFAEGSRIAGYRLEKQVGAGGMSVVFRARDERLDRLVALKILAPALAADEAFRQRFMRESHTAAAVDDPHIIPVYEAGEAGTVLFIAMRYVSGGDVQTLIHRAGPLSPERVAAIISPVASALDAAHAAGLVHRDVKPANILVDTRPGRPDHVYLSDFGLSKGAMSSVGITGTGQLLGTPHYMAPEQIEGRLVDGRADQYALACVVFALLTGEPPFQRDQGMAVMYAHMQQPPPALASRRRGLPPAADAVLARALAKAPGDRYTSCREFVEALRMVFGLAPYDSGPRVIPPAPHPATEVAWPHGGAVDQDIPVAHAFAETIDSPRAWQVPPPVNRYAAVDRPQTRATGQPTRRGHVRYAAIAAVAAVAVALAVVYFATHNSGYNSTAGGAPHSQPPARPAATRPPSTRPASTRPAPASAGVLPRWSQPTAVDQGGQFNSVSCASPSLCAAVDNNGNIFTTHSGTSWSAPVSTGNLLGSVSCPSNSFCETVGYNDTGGNVFTLHGRSWSAPQLIDPGYKLHSVSCSSASFCVAGAAVNVFLYSGGSWSSATSVDQSDTNGTGVTSVSCATSSFCVAVDAIGNVLTYAGGSWSSPRDVDHGGQLDSVSCASSSFCVAVDATGNVLTYAGGSWSSPRDVDHGGQLDSVSCASSSFCVAVDTAGNVLTMK